MREKSSRKVARPRRGRVFLRDLTDSAFITEAGIELPASAPGEQEMIRAVVVQLGPPLIEDGHEIPYDMKVGDEVLTIFHAGRRFRYYESDGTVRELWMVAEGEIFTVFEDEVELDNLTERSFGHGN